MAVDRETNASPRYMTMYFPISIKSIEGFEEIFIIGIIGE